MFGGDVNKAIRQISLAEEAVPAAAATELSFPLYHIQMLITWHHCRC